MNLLTKEEIEHFVKDNHLFPPTSRLEITDILRELDESEGLVNQIYKIKDKDRSVVIKQVLPFALAIKNEMGVEHPMDPGRIELETKALSFLNTFWKGSAPEIYKLNWDHGLIVMEDLTHLNNLRFELPKAREYPALGLQLGTLLAGLRYYTSDLYLNEAEREQFIKYFDNQIHRENMTNMILGPESFLFNPESFDPSVHEIQKRANTDPYIVAVVEDMRDALINSLECFSHMDLHIGNILIDKDDIKIIDSEFSGMGTSFMDLGRLASSFLINYFSWLFYPKEHPMREKMLSYNLQTIFDLFESYRLTLKSLLPETYESIYRPVFENSLRLLLLSLILRLQNGIALSYDIGLLGSQEKIAEAQKLSFELLIECFPKIKDYAEISDFINSILEFTRELR